MLLYLPCIHQGMPKVDLTRKQISTVWGLVMSRREDLEDSTNIYDKQELENIKKIEARIKKSWSEQE